MILVDIEVPIMGKRYDFQVDECVCIAALLEELWTVICLTEQCELSGKAEDLELWDKTLQRLLEKDRTLSDYQIHTGNSLLLL